MSNYKWQAVQKHRWGWGFSLQVITDYWHLLSPVITLHYIYAGNRFAIDCDPRKGLACINSEQTGGGRCQDYRVRFLCPEGTIQDTRGIQCQDFCETPFYDRDNPGGYCDCEQRSLGPYFGPTPVGIRCIERTTGKDYQDIGQRMTCTPLVSTPSLVKL